MKSSRFGGFITVFVLILGFMAFVSAQDLVTWVNYYPYVQMQGYNQVLAHEYHIPVEHSYRPPSNIRPGSAIREYGIDWWPIRSIQEGNDLIITNAVVYFKSFGLRGRFYRYSASSPVVRGSVGSQEFISLMDSARYIIGGIFMFDRGFYPLVDFDGPLLRAPTDYWVESGLNILTGRFGLVVNLARQVDMDIFVDAVRMNLHHNIGFRMRAHFYYGPMDLENFVTIKERARVRLSAIGPGVALSVLRGAMLFNFSYSQLGTLIDNDVVFTDTDSARYTDGKMVTNYHYVGTIKNDELYWGIIQHFDLAISGALPLKYSEDFLVFLPFGVWAESWFNVPVEASLSAPGDWTLYEGTNFKQDRANLWMAGAYFGVGVKW